MKKDKPTITLNGKIYPVEIRDGMVYIDNKPINKFIADFLNTLDSVTLLELSESGAMTQLAKLRGETPPGYIEMMEILYKTRNN